MPRTLSLALAITDGAFLLYWAASALAAAGALHLPPAFMYAGYGEVRVTAWNWSFMPLDVAFSVCGLAAVAASRHGDALWRPLALISLVLTSVTGGMAVGYWTLLREFDPAWFLPNLALLLWPVVYLPGLVRALAGR
jgi:hypothetical protein